MKAYKGHRGLAPLIQPQHYLEMNQQLQALVTLSPREVNQYLLNRSLVWLQILKVLEKRKISCSAGSI